MKSDNELTINYDAYLRSSNPQVRRNVFAWCIGIGLQAVDGLHTSEFLQKMAIKSIKGETSFSEVYNLLQQYHEYKASKGEFSRHRREADLASAHIAETLLSPAVPFSVEGFKQIHRSIFGLLIENAGQLRDHNIFKKEMVLDGDTVLYEDADNLLPFLQQVIDEETDFSYEGLTVEQIVRHITEFTARIWRIHVFPEGNTRAVATFVIQHLTGKGVELNPTYFAKYSAYFRNALVRANYSNPSKGVQLSPQYLERFFRNMLMGEIWDLKSRYLMIHPSERYREQPRYEATHTTRFDDFD